MLVLTAVTRPANGTCLWFTLVVCAVRAPGHQVARLAKLPLTPDATAVTLVKSPERAISRMFSINKLVVNHKQAEDTTKE